MPALETKNIPLGFKAPDFYLEDQISGEYLSFKDLKGEHGTLVAFICNHCPYVKHMIDRLVEVGKSYMPKGIGFVMINSNDVENYPDDAPDKMTDFAKAHDFPFPYLFDESQQIAKAYQAVCTPDFNLFNADDLCVYRGQFDASRPGNSIQVSGADLIKALDLCIDQKPIPVEQIPSMGCSIKWKNQ